MIIKELTLKDYRNIEHINICPDENVNVIFGNNAQGKTNFIEAIFLLSGKKSFRTSSEQDYVRFGCDTAEIDAVFLGGKREQTLNMRFGKEKQILLNELPVTVGELMGRFFCVEFSPQLLSIIKDGPSERRNFLDCCISEVMPRYQHTMNNYKRVVSERNALLSDVKYNSSYLPMLDAWDESLAKLIVSIVNARRRYIKRLKPFAAEYYSRMCGGKEIFDIAYQSTADFPENLTLKEGEERVLNEISKARQDDIRYGYTTVGAHRDDLIFTVDKKIARSFASQGQQRSAAIALKLAECEVIREVTGEMPILLLDDVLSELDKKRRDFFLRNIQASQIFITCCDRNMLKGMNIGRTFRMKDGRIMTGGK